MKKRSFLTSLGLAIASLIGTAGISPVAAAVDSNSNIGMRQSAAISSGLVLSPAGASALHHAQHESHESHSSHYSHDSHESHSSHDSHESHSSHVSGM